MKVTQIIKNAITARVNAKCEEANKKAKLALKAELDRLDNERKTMLAKLEKDYQKAFMTMLAKLDSKKISYVYSSYSNNFSSKEEIWERNSPNICITLNSDLAKKLQEDILANEQKARQYINDIILELELGTKKEDLEVLLNSISF
jgi:hypothetical protein